MFRIPPPEGRTEGPLALLHALNSMAGGWQCTEESNAANAAVMLDAPTGQPVSTGGQHFVCATSRSVETQNEFAIYTRKSGGL